MSTTPVEPEIDEATKLRFAELMLRLNNPSAAASEICPGNPGRALWFARLLQSDPFVIAEIARLKEDKGELEFLPTKAIAARKIWERAEACQDPDGFAKLMRLYGEFTGNIEKPGQNVTVAVAVQNVMVVKDHGSDEEWERKAREQQTELVINAIN